MKTIIIYTTRHGCTQKAVEIIKDGLKGNIYAVNIKKESAHDISEYDSIIVGGSIHAGQIQSKIKEFCSKNIEILKQKRLGLFLCCMQEGDKAREQFEQAYNHELIEHACATGIFGGEFNFERMNFIEKLIVKKVSKVKESVSRIDKKAISEFIETFSSTK